VVAPSSILESSTDAPDDRQLKNLKFQTPLATTKNGFPDTLLGSAAKFLFGTNWDEFVLRIVMTEGTKSGCVSLRLHAVA
ncbi:MAG: hypothetical protein WBH28_09650, partial [Fuerstiella sp.]